MNLKSKNKMWGMIVKDLSVIRNRHEEISKRLDENAQDQREDFRALFDQYAQPSSVPIVTKTPKVTRKRGFQRIETIPENDILEQDDTAVQTISENKDASSIAGGRAKRMASLRAVDNIAKQSLILTQDAKVRTLSNNNSSFSMRKRKQENQLKRKVSAHSSDEDEKQTVFKHSKLDESVENKDSRKASTREAIEQSAQSKVGKVTAKDVDEQNASLRSQRSSLKSQRSSRKTSRGKETEKEIDVIISPTTNIIEDSIYEDAIGKPTPIMNSTLKNNNVVLEKMFNSTVVLQPLSKRQLNETVVIHKASKEWNSRENSRERISLRSIQQRDTLSNDNATTKNNIVNTCDDLITDDESSPEIKKSKKQIFKKHKKQVITSDEDEDEVPNTPEKKEYFKQPTMLPIMQETRTIHKPNALFSPYAKESVKKRVEAFEQAVIQSPKSVSVDAPTRITRTKTRAMAAAEAESDTKKEDKNYTQILARKSLAKAKKIACLMEKQKKGNEEQKENKEQMPEKVNKAIKYDKINMMPQSKATPLSKLKIMAPMSATRIQTPSNTQNLANHAKALTASRANIVTALESFIQVPKTISKANSTDKLDKLEDKKRQEEDALKKRKEALRLQMEEKRRKREEKELKNKQAREAKEKQELEKRQRMEKEKEEKAKLAQMLQEKLREEAEKKRLAQLQRAQEKEERRKLEEQQRLQRLQEQEEAERLLAEQKRREQEAERRKEMEARAQQQAEALRQKNMAQACQIKYKQAAANKQHAETNYVLDSEPDDDESDDENRPKHEIPYWAQSHVRKVQLAMQRYIPEEFVFKFFGSCKCTPDLTEIFQGIDRSRLKRTSSAIWKTPPRFSMMEGD